MTDLPSLLVQLRGALSTADLAHKARASARAIQLYEAGDSLPSGRMIVAIVRAVKPPPDLRDAIMAAWRAAKAAQHQERAAARRAKSNAAVPA